MTKEGLVNQKETGRPHYYTYIFKGENQQLETWHPRFSYYGYRYLQIEGDIEVLKDIESCFIYNSAEKTGDFECSNPLFNDAYRLPLLPHCAGTHDFSPVIVLPQFFPKLNPPLFRCLPNRLLPS